MKSRPLALTFDNAISINELVSLVKAEGQWSYFYGVQPISYHPEDDKNSFHQMLGMMCANRMCKASEVMRALGVPERSLLRYVADYRNKGNRAFFEPRKGRGPSVLTAEMTVKAQAMLDEGRSRSEVSKELSVSYDTLRKATESGRLRDPKKCVSSNDVSESVSSEESRDDASTPVFSGFPELSLGTMPKDKSARSQADFEASSEMGIACTRPSDRVLASLGGMQTGASIEFQHGHDVSLGGVLCALPALAENGLFKYMDVLPVLSGYYTTLHVLLVLAFMALCRIKTVEQLQEKGEPGELGKLMGLDRVPEVRCLREKLQTLCNGELVQNWAAQLSKGWMDQNPELAGTLYADGHVRLYHGELTKLPRRFVSRQRLCLRGTTDYWINDALGQPFFSVERTLDHGLLEALRTDIVPRLLKEVPCQPMPQQLEDNPCLSRFVIVFDREGYSPAFFREMWKEHRIACITYHKHPKDIWDETWFLETQVRMPDGEIVTMKVAEMGSWIGSRKDGLWVREIRKLCKSGHQTSLISTVFSQPGPEIAGRLFSRWCQENFFRYMMENYAIDALSEYGTEIIPGSSKPIVNPAWRDLDRRHKSVKSKLTVRQARFAAMTLHPQAQDLEIRKWEREKAALTEEIGQLEHDVNLLKTQLKDVPHHVFWEDLPEHERFERLAPARKRLMDTVKLVAYRAETAMAQIVREKMSHPKEARALVRAILQSDADITPDLSSKTLNVKLHTLATPRANRAAQHLLDHLNAAEFTYPGTALTMTFTLPTPTGNPCLSPK